MAKKKRKRIRKPAPGKKKIYPDEVEPKKPGGLESPQGPSSPSKPGTVGKKTKKVTKKPN